MSPTCSSQEPSLYANLPMHGRQIRLIEIISTKPEIVCKLEVVNLEDEPAYSALSYVWGDPKVTQSLLVNGKRTNVTVNLASALEHAPKHLKDANVAPRLWADALCIDQDDPDEKNHQVPLMKDIYSQAEIVICWLGAPDDNIHRAMDWIDVIARECSFEDDNKKLQDAFHNLRLQKDPEKANPVNTTSPTRSGTSGDASDIDPNEAATMESSGATNALASYQNSLQELSKGWTPTPESPNLAWLSKYPSFYKRIDKSKDGIRELYSMFCLPYWARVWIFQEIALAKWPIFACGTRSISLASLDQLARWTQWLTSDTTIVKPQVMNPIQWEVTKFTSRIIYGELKPRFEARRTAGHPISACLKTRSRQISPESHWRMACNLSTSNPKDYFYGFLSLSCLNLVPNYSATTSVGTVCRDFMVEYVRASREGSLGTTSGELDLLVFAGVGHRWHQYPDTPSWAPNFPGLGKSKWGGSPVFSSRLSHFEHLFLPSDKSARFSGSDMRVGVLILDTIQRLGPLRQEMNDVEAWQGPQGIIPWIVDFATRREEYVAGCHPLAALHSMFHFESVIQEDEPALCIPVLKNAMGFVQWVTLHYKDEASDGEENAGSDRPSPKAEYLNHLLGGLPINETAVNEACSRLSESCFGKAQRLAETRLSYVGIFPLHVQPGDVVCVLNGLRCPAVLRKVDENYLFVGTCFVQGLESMEQVRQLKKEQGKRVETVVIR